MKIAGRYEITATVGKGGMGVVYRAYDPAPMDREVAVKTLHEFADPLALDLFYRECRALKSISHPNIVEIFDMGEFEEGGQKRPFFVMPLLPGQTLDELIRKSSHRLTVDRVVEIVTQTCRGLQAAHDRGLIHRDLKPSNIFVMADDAVKLIDFGVAHVATAHSRTTGFDKGTLLYMAPEQLQHKPVSVQSDIYALGLTMYEALTRRQPFRLGTEQEVIDAILNQVPPPASSLNPAVSQLMSRAVHKAIAKQPGNRYETAREFAETLQKALRNEPIPFFDPARVNPRIQTALKALEKGDEQFAEEIVSELEAEGNTDSQIGMLRAQINEAARQKRLAQLLQSAQARYEEGEDPLALQKINDALHLDPANTSALELKARIEERRSDQQFERWITLARQHIESRAYANAHDALQNAMALRPDDPRVTEVMREVEAAEQGRPIPSASSARVTTASEPTLLKPSSGTRLPTSSRTSAPVAVDHAAPASTPVEKKREPSSPRRLVAIVGGIAAVAVIAVGAFMLPRLTAPGVQAPGVQESAVPSTPTAAPADPPAAPAPPPLTSPLAPVVESAPAVVSTPPPALQTPPAPIPAPAPVAPSLPAPRPAAAAPRPTPAAPAPAPVAPATQSPAIQTPAPAASAPAPAAESRPPAATPQAGATDPVLPPVMAQQLAMQLLGQGAAAEKVENWSAALQFYERARRLDPNLSLATSGVSRVQAQMLADGTEAFKRAQVFDTANRINDAITWYERAVRNLPESSPEKRIASERLRALKSGR